MEWKFKKLRQSYLLALSLPRCWWVQDLRRPDADVQVKQQMLELFGCGFQVVFFGVPLSVVYFLCHASHKIVPA